MFDDIQYVVRFENGKYYRSGFSSDSETDELKYANKYTFEWQIIKDMYLSLYITEHNLSYKTIKVKTHYEIVD